MMVQPSGCKYFFSCEVADFMSKKCNGFNSLEKLCVKYKEFEENYLTK